MGEGLGGLNLRDLKNLESKIEKGISKIRAKKVYITFHSPPNKTFIFIISFTPLF